MRFLHLPCSEKEAADGGTNVIVTSKYTVYNFIPVSLTLESQGCKGGRGINLCHQLVPVI
jgi:hypothetical protein